MTHLEVCNLVAADGYRYFLPVFHPAVFLDSSGVLVNTFSSEGWCPALPLTLGGHLMSIRSQSRSAPECHCLVAYLWRWCRVRYVLFRLLSSPTEFSLLGS